MYHPILIREKYKVITKIGQGKFGSVFKAINVKKRDQETKNNLVAIKIASCGILKHETTILNYLNKHDCKNVPLVHWYGLFENNHCLVIPFYHYGLPQYINDINNQDNEHKILLIDKLMQNMLDILKNCHELLVIHRDIKPDNFMFNRNDELILLDFGLATFIDINQEDENITTNKFIGNLIFASPNIHNHKTPKKNDDIISIAYIYLLIYLGGKLPWMNINDNTDIFIEESLNNENRFNEILVLKDLENIASCKTCESKIFKFIENAYNNKISYIF